MEDENELHAFHLNLCLFIILYSWLQIKVRLWGPLCTTQFSTTFSNLSISQLSPYGCFRICSMTDFRFYMTEFRCTYQTSRAGCMGDVSELSGLRQWHLLLTLISLIHLPWVTCRSLCVILRVITLKTPHACDTDHLHRLNITIEEQQTSQ